MTRANASAITVTITTAARATHVDDRVLPGDAQHVVHRTTREWFSACARVGKTMRGRIPRLRWANTGLCTIHSPYYLYYSFTDHMSRKATL
jgi:hypothetical protein